jgi:hypothetical protein
MTHLRSPPFAASLLHRALCYFHSPRADRADAASALAALAASSLHRACRR